MGIMNVAPDSFFRGSRSLTPSSIKDRAEEMIKAGVDIIDIGAYSSRPGAEGVTVNDELSRAREALEAVRNNFPDAIISLDTFREEVARVGIEEYDVDIVNDISGGSMDNKMYGLIAEKNIPYILMHMLGTPETMQNNPVYQDLIPDLILWFSERINKLTGMGVNDIIIDPGFGFGKTLEHNYELMKGLHRFEILERPLLVGISRKSMIWKELGKSPDDSLPGTIALNTLALNKGANIIRVHDVEAAIQTVKIFNRATD